MSAHPFLSPAWIDAARSIHDDIKDRIPEPDEHVRMNVTVVDAPFSDGTVIGHVDTTSGSAVPREDHISEPDLAIRVPYEIARRVLVEQQYDMLMISFMSGEIEVEGDITRLLELQDLQPTDEQQELAEAIIARLRAITA